MKRFLSIILALAMTIALIPAVSAEGETYVFKMYGYEKNFDFVLQTDVADTGDNALFNGKDLGTGYVTFADGTAYISNSESNYYGKGSTVANFWYNSTNTNKNITINSENLTSAVYAPRIAVASKIGTSESIKSKERYVTFKFKVGTPNSSNNYTITTETLYRPQGGSFAIYANGAYLGRIDDYVVSNDSKYKNVHLTSFEEPVRLISDENGYVSLTFYLLTENGTYSTSETVSLMPLCITFTEVADAGNYLDTVSVGASVKNSVGGKIETTDIVVGSSNDVAVGKEISLKTVADTGYKFAYWTDSEGRALSEETTYKFKAYCNTAVYAVFNKVNDTSKIGVDFFDGNRDYLGFKSVTSGTPFRDVEKPAYGITGYTFKGWSIDDNTAINSFLRAVALYEEEGNELTGSTITVNGAAQGTKKYGEEVECSDDTATAWYLNDKLVAYGTTYTHLAWGSATITSKSDEIADKAPAVVLNANGDAYMMEYDKGDYEILEAGILFGNDTHKTLSSCYTKAKVKDIADHGYFTAKIKADGTEGMQTVARGYVVYKNGDGICVKYSD